MNEDTIRDIYYVEHKWNPHFFYLSPKSFCQDLEKNGSDLYLDLFHAMYQEESDYICPYTENDCKRTIASTLSAKSRFRGFS